MASPVRSSVTLAQRFTYVPGELAASASTRRASSSSPASSASKRRRVENDGESSSSSRSAVKVASSSSTTTSIDTTAKAAAIFESTDANAYSDVISGGVKRDEAAVPSTAQIASTSKQSSAANTQQKSGVASAKSIEIDHSTHDRNDFVKSFSDGLSSKAGSDGLSERQLLQLECETMHPTWLAALQKELKQSYFIKLKRFLWSEGVKSASEASKTIFPPAREIYSWSRYTPLPNVRVVILGQDPYHNVGQAHGLCFSVRSNVKVPPSLKNIYKEIKTDYPQFDVPNHGYLASWAEQGVLLLNTALTVRAHQANSHSKKGWEEFTDAVIRAVDERPGPGVVFLAWGLPAQKRIKGIDTSKHLVLASAHPSPLSARTGFHGNGHFKRANAWLKDKYGDDDAQIDWCRLYPEPVNTSKVDIQTPDRPPTPIEVTDGKVVK